MEGVVLTAGELFMILDLHRQGLSISAIARRLELDRKTVRRYIARGLEPPIYGPRAPRPQKIDPYLEFLTRSAAGIPTADGGAAASCKPRAAVHGFDRMIHCGCTRNRVSS